MASYESLKARFGSAAEVGMVEGEELLDPVAASGSTAEFQREIEELIAEANYGKSDSVDWYMATDEIAKTLSGLGIDLDYLERRAIYESPGEHRVLWECMRHRPDLVEVCIDAIMDVWYCPENWPLGFATQETALVLSAEERASRIYKGWEIRRSGVIWERPRRRVAIPQIKRRLAR